jgi:hypothetical protein
MLFLSMLFGFSIAYCQNNKKNLDTLKITFKDGEMIKKTPFNELRNGQVLKIEIQNINPFLFDITTKQYQNDFLNEMNNEQAILLNYNLGGLTIDLPEANVISLSAVEVKDKNFRATTNKIFDSLSKVQKYINEVYYKKIEPLRDSIKIHNGEEEYIKSKNNDIDAIEIGIASITRTRDSLNIALRNLKTDDSNGIAFISQNLFNTVLRDYNLEVNKLQAFFKFFQALKLLVYSSGKTIEEMSSEKVELANSYLNELDLHKTKITDLALLKKVHDIFNKIDKSRLDLDRIYLDFLIRKGNTQVEKDITVNMGLIISSINDQKKKVNINSLDLIVGNTVLLYNAINKESFTFRFLINNIKEKTDFVSFEFNAVSKNAIPYIVKPKPISYSLTIPLKGGIQMNVSSGFFFNFGIHDKQYKYQAIDAKDSLFSVIETSPKFKQYFSPSIGLMLHVYQRSNSSTKFAGSFGFSTNNATDLRYYLGGSLILGKTQRLVVTSGAVGAQRQILKSTFGEGRFTDVGNQIQVSKQFKDNNINIPTESKFRIGWFVSLTFNLWGKSNKEFDFESLQKPSSK